MSIKATGPFPIFFDSYGEPLSFGYVYFGVSGANPETTPQAVFWDEALTIPAAQPIRTLNGFLVRNGTPASVYTAAVYSITVRDKNLTLLYSSLVNVGIPYSTAMIPVTSAATLAAARTALGVSKKIKGYQAISISHLSDTLEPEVLAGSELEVDGTFYEFTINEAAVAGGWAAIAVSTLVYMYLVPAGAAHTWIYSIVAPTWDTAKQGWYNGANRCFGGLYKNAGGNYSLKWLYRNAGGVQAKEYSNVVFLTTGSSPFDCPLTAGLTAIINATTNPYVFNLPAATGSGYEIDVIDSSILATGLVRITPRGADVIGAAGNVSCFLQNVDQSGFVYVFQHLRLRDSRAGYWEIVDGQFCPDQAVDTDGAQYHLGKLHHLPLGNTTSRVVSNAACPGVGTWSGAIQATGVAGIPAGAKGFRARVELSSSPTAGGDCVRTIGFSDNNANVPALSANGTAHPVVSHRFKAAAGGDWVNDYSEIDIPINSAGQFYMYTITLNNISAATGTAIVAVGFYMGD